MLQNLNKYTALALAICKTYCNLYKHKLYYMLRRKFAALRETTTQGNRSTELKFYVYNLWMSTKQLQV